MEGITIINSVQIEYDIVGVWLAIVIYIVVCVGPRENKVFAQNLFCLTENNLKPKLVLL